MKIRLKRLDQAGFDHVVVVVVFVALFALVGTWLLLESRAATPTYQYKMWLNNSTKNTGLCLDDSSSSTAIISYPCNSGDSYQQWTTVSASGGFLLKNIKTGQCVDDSGDGVGTNANNRVHVISWSCNTADHAQVWTWASDGSYGQLKNKYNSGCINDPTSSTSQQQLIVYPCSGTGKTAFQQSAVTVSTGGSSGGNGAAFLARAERYQGLGYANLGSGYGEGGIVHASGYSTFVKDCEGGRSGGTPKIMGGTNALCATDCSGFISLVVDDVLHTSYVWIAGAQVMTGGGASHWHAVSASSAKPGDIAVANDHVEFVRSGTGAGLTSYGEHSSGTTVGSAHMPTPFTVYRWE